MSEQSQNASSDLLIDVYRRKPGEELRLMLTTYNGSQFVNLRMFALNDDDEWVPTKKGCSIKLGEVGSLIESLTHIQRFTNSD